MFELSIILNTNIKLKYFCQFCSSKLKVFEEITIFRKRRKLTLSQNYDCQSPFHIHYLAECQNFQQLHRSEICGFSSVTLQAEGCADLEKYSVSGACQAHSGWHHQAWNCSWPLKHLALHPGNEECSSYIWNTKCSINDNLSKNLWHHLQSTIWWHVNRKITNLKLWVGN